MTIEIHSAAKAELRDAADYYDDQREGLGLEFLAEIESLLHRVERTPDLHPPVWGEVRRVLGKRFPYSILYWTRPDGTIQVIAVAHLSRRPQYWLGRLSD